MGTDDHVINYRTTTIRPQACWTREEEDHCGDGSNVSEDATTHAIAGAQENCGKGRNHSVEMTHMGPTSRKVTEPIEKILFLKLRSAPTGVNGNKTLLADAILSPEFRQRRWKYAKKRVRNHKKARPIGPRLY